MLGNRALSGATYSPDIRARRSLRMPRETFRLRVPATFAVSIRPAGITRGETHRFRCDNDIRFLRAGHEFSASCIFDVAPEYCRGLLMARDLSRRFFHREFRSARSRSRIEVHRNAVCQRCNNLFSSFVACLDTARKTRKYTCDRQAVEIYENVTQYIKYFVSKIFLVCIKMIQFCLIVELEFSSLNFETKVF